MTIPIPAKHGRVVWRVAAITSDGDDADLLPDYLPPTGTVIFTPQATAMKIKNAIPKAITVLPMPVTCGIDADGDLCYPVPGEGVVTNKFVNLLATDDPEVNPIGFTWMVSFKLFYNSTVLPLASFPIDVPLDTEVDLTQVAPVASSGGTQIIRGEDGQDNALQIGTVTTGEVAAASITGTFPLQTLDLVLPSSGGGGAQDTGTWQRTTNTGPAGGAAKTTIQRVGDMVTVTVTTRAQASIEDSQPILVNGPSDFAEGFRGPVIFLTQPYVAGRGVITGEISLLLYSNSIQIDMWNSNVDLSDAGIYNKYGQIFVTWTYRTFDAFPSDPAAVLPGFMLMTSASQWNA